MQLRSLWALGVALCAFATLSWPVMAEDGRPLGAAETVEIGGVRSILIRVDRPKGSLVVLTGGDGVLAVDSRGKFTGNASSVLIRNRDAFAAGGFDVLLVEKGTSLADAVRHMEALKRPVTIVATSAGTPRAAEGLRAGARPDRLILTSGFLSRKSGPGSSVASILGSPAALPPTLVIHHRQDACQFTSPAGVAPLSPGQRVALRSSG